MLKATGPTTSVREGYLACCECPQHLKTKPRAHLLRKHDQSVRECVLHILRCMPVIFSYRESSSSSDDVTVVRSVNAASLHATAKARARLCRRQFTHLTVSHIRFVCMHQEALSSGGGSSTHLTLQDKSTYTIVNANSHS